MLYLLVCDNLALTTIPIVFRNILHSNAIPYLMVGKPATYEARDLLGLM